MPSKEEYKTYCSRIGVIVIAISFILLFIYSVYKEKVSSVLEETKQKKLVTDKYIKNDKILYTSGILLLIGAILILISVYYKYN